jgi:hypothetical protein
MPTRPYNILLAAIAILMAALTTVTLATAIMEFPSRWGGYLILLFWLASAWSGLSLLWRRNGLALLILFFSLSVAIGGLPIAMIAFSSD